MPFRTTPPAVLFCEKYHTYKTPHLSREVGCFSILRILRVVLLAHEGHDRVLAGARHKEGDRDGEQ